MRHGERLAHGLFPFSPPRLHAKPKDLGSVSQGILKLGTSQLREEAHCEADAGFDLLSCQRHNFSERQRSTSQSLLSRFPGGHVHQPAMGLGKPPLRPWQWGTPVSPKICTQQQHRQGGAAAMCCRAWGGRGQSWLVASVQRSAAMLCYRASQLEKHTLPPGR